MARWGFLALAGLTALAVSGGAPNPAHACGYETPGECDGAVAGASDARWMLNRVVAAVGRDEPAALDAFVHGASGFRTQDLYVFCMEPATGMMVSHPDPRLMQHDARTLHDVTGKPFAELMMQDAKEGSIESINYLWPRLGSSAPEPKTTYFTRVKNLVCAVGFYGSVSPAEPPPPPTLAELEQRLGAEMPDSLKADWTAFRQALHDRDLTEHAALEKARASLEAASQVASLQ